MIEEYSHIAEGATNLMAVELDGNKADEYLKKNYSMPEYNRILDRFYDIRNSYPDIMYMYVYRLDHDGGTVIFDLSSVKGAEDAGIPGERYEFSDLFMSYIDDLCAGKEVGGIIGPTEDGYILTYCKPIFDSKGKLQFHACVDFSIDALRKEDNRFMTSILLVAGLTGLAIMLFGIWWIRYRVTGPLNRMSRATEEFSYRTQQENERNILIMESLNINTHDEIETLYRAFISVMQQSLVYMNDLQKAESDIRDKEQKLGQISVKVFRDALTSVGNKAAYNSLAGELNEAIKDGNAEFGIVMLDANNLKYINDNFGHDAGDSYIKGCCKIVCEIFSRSPVFRVGGDEFTVVLKGADYENRLHLLDELSKRFNASYKQTDKEAWERFSMSFGMAEYIHDDTSVNDVLKRADTEMYVYKTEFKRKFGSYR